MNEFWISEGPGGGGESKSPAVWFSKTMQDGNHSQARKVDPIITLVMWKVKNPLDLEKIKKIHKKPKTIQQVKSILSDELENKFLIIKKIKI